MFRYWIEYLSDYDNDFHKESGFVSGDDYMTAVNRIVDYYGGTECVVRLTTEPLIDVLTIDEMREECERE